MELRILTAVNIEKCLPMPDAIEGMKRAYAALGKTVDEITYFKSVGVAVQDAITAAIALRNAEAMGLGTTVTL